MSETNEIREAIAGAIGEHEVILFMKGTPGFPQCGFSGRAIQILKQAGARNLVTVNVLDDDDVRQGIKDFSNWPTIPQVYIDGQFVGGSDILMEMFESGELAEALGVEQPENAQAPQAQQAPQQSPPLQIE